jgi:NAD(P)-dependent dehydrogenase (short-subunit alcohol dehydrogenase family)
MRLKDKVALIAGGAQGIGEGIVLCLAEEGADVIVCDINVDSAGKVAEVCRKMGRKAETVGADLTKSEEVERAIREALEVFGRIDILVNCVGGQSQETTEIVRESYVALGDANLPQFLAYGPELWDRFYALNLKSHAMLCNAIVPHLIKQGSGNIINVASISGRLPDPMLAPYAACKAGDISLTWTLARALAPYNIRVNCICPGLVYTPLWERGATAILQSLRDALSRGETPQGLLGLIPPDDVANLSPKEFWLRYLVLPSTPLLREQTPEDMGRAVAFLVSDDAKNITGQILHIDGGQVTR